MIRDLFITFALVFTAFEAFACGWVDEEEALKYKPDLANKIVFARVVIAKYSPKSNASKFQLSPIEIFKGDVSENEWFETRFSYGDELGPQVGQTYLIFFDEGSAVNFCTMAHPIGPIFNTPLALRDWSGRVDIPYAEIVRRVISKYGKAH